MYNRRELWRELCLGWMARTLITALGMLIGFTLWTSSVNAQTKPSAEEIEAAYSEDPLGLIAYSGRTRIYSSNSSIWPDRLEVWACNTHSGIPSLRVDPAQLVEQFREVAVPYFSWLSNSLYAPEFVAGGTVTVATDRDCRDAVATKSRSESKEFRGVIIMADTDGVLHQSSGEKMAEKVAGYAGPGIRCHRWLSTDLCFWPNNKRSAVLESNRVGSSNRFHDYALVHEIGHMLNFPHSFSDHDNEYSNQMDIMSGGTFNTGTLAINRYAAGWIPDSQVEVHPVSEDNPRPGSLYELASIGQQGTQMLALPVRPGEFYTLEARVKSRYDDIPSKGEGVEVYTIDQSLIAGESLIGQPADSDWCDSGDNRHRGVCVGLWRRTKPFTTTINSGDPFGHVYSVGDEDIVLDDDWNIRIRVLNRTEKGYEVWVGPGPLDGYFFDDEDSPHKDYIDLLAESGITQGCDRYRFCPQNEVTRAQMAVFLARALGLTVTTDDEISSVDFSDVDPRAWYAGYLNALGSIASGDSDGAFRPSQPITRGEAAIMLNRALTLDGDENRDTFVFTDVPDGTELMTAAANLAAAGITRGCEPTLFCPDNFLTRGQMAALLMRSPFLFDALSDDDDGEVHSDGREVRISVGTDASSRSECPQDAVCRNYRYELIGFGPAPYTLECWINGRRIWSGNWSGRPERGCYSWGSGQTVHVVVDGVKSNELLWGLPDGREVRISVGTDASGRSECPQGAVCRNYRYELIGFGPAPYTLECWGKAAYMSDSRLMWSGNWSGRPERGCYSWGSGQTVHVVVDGVKSNELLWVQPDDVEVQPDGRRVRISVGEVSNRCPLGVVCEGLHRDYRYELIGFGPAPYTLECWVNGRRIWSGNWSGRSSRGCYSWGSGQTVHVVVDGVKSNELLWVLPG